MEIHDALARKRRNIESTIQYWREGIPIRQAWITKFDMIKYQGNHQVKREVLPWYVQNQF